MNKYILSFLSVVIACSAQAQCLTNTLKINTGYNPVTNTAITPGANGAAPVTDPYWVLTSMSAATSAAIAATPGGYIPVTPGNKANVIQPVGSAWITNPVGNPGAWISGLNSNTYNDQGNGLPLTMTFGRPFRMCTDDSITITINITSDNLTTAADIDGTIVIPTPVTGFSSYTFYTYTVWLTAGIHTLHFEVTNQNVSSVSSNPTGLNLYGTLSSTSGLNSIVSESYASCATYNCGSTCNTISLPDSVHLCQGAKDTLRAIVIGTDPVLSQAWTPATGLNSTSVLRPEVTAGTTSGYYYLTVQSLTPYNLVNNGDFNLGNTGFSSTYTYVTGANSLQPEATYAVTTNPINVHSGAVSFTNHTTGGGNMMVVNGSSTPTSFWCQTIPVTPNTDYAFSAWVANWSNASSGASAPILQFQINSALIGSALTLNSAPGVWVNFYAVWNSGPNTSANICIYDACTALGGNDFAIDDISFQKMCIARDSIYLDVHLFDTTYMRQDTNVCNGVAVNLSAPAGYSPYVWNTGATGRNYTATTAGTYWVYAGATCATLIDTFKVAYKPIPSTPVTRDTIYCKDLANPVPLDQLVTGYTGTLQWYTANGSPSGSTPVSSTATVNYPYGETWYVSQVINGCEGDTAAVNVRIIDSPAVHIVTRDWICQHDSMLLAFSGSKLEDGGFLWTLPEGASFIGGTDKNDSMVYVKFDSTNSDGMVYLIASNLDGQCYRSDRIKINVVSLPVASSSTKRDVCIGDTVTLALASKSSNSTDFAWYVDNSALFTSPALNIISSNSNHGGPFLIRWQNSGVHYIYLQSFTKEGCTDVPVADTVAVRDLPDARFVVDTAGKGLCIEDSVLFVSYDSSYMNAYRWEPEAFFHNMDKRAAWGRLRSGNSTITLTVTDPYGCDASVSKQIQADACCIVPFPNAFTPNGDGLNDVFRPIPMKAFHSYHVFRITNRWGQVVYTSTDNRGSWDGTMNGVPQDVGVYYYYLKYDCDGKTLEEKGDVTLVR